MSDNGDKFFYHFIAGSMLAMAVLVTPLIFFLLVAIWQQGLTFVTVLTVSVAAFCWVTHKLAGFISTKEDIF